MSPPIAPAWLRGALAGSRHGLVPGPQGSGLSRGAHIRPPRGIDRPEGGCWRPRAAGARVGHSITPIPGEDKQGNPKGRERVVALGGGGAPERKVWKREGKGQDPLSWGRACGAGHQRPHSVEPGRALLRSCGGGKAVPWRGPGLGGFSEHRPLPFLAHPSG